MRKKYLLFILSFLSLSISTFAQYRVKITIREAGTQQPLLGAHITIALHKNHPDTLIAITDKEGKAFINLEKENASYFYKVNMMGYMPVSGTILAIEKEVNIVLKEDVMHLNGVVVTGSRTERPVKLSPITTQVLGGKALVDAGYSDLQHALQQETPGMNIQKVGFGNEISMQGLDARHVLFLQDGERMTGDMAGNLDYERFNLHAIDRIEIVKGASSTLYGSRASGAVINLISKKTQKPLDIQAGVRFAQMNQRNYKQPNPKDFLYMFEKNSDRPNLQSWISAGIKQGKFTSQTDIWYSSSDAFYMYQSDKDKKVYTKEANPFLPHDITLTSIAPRSPMGIEGTEHLSVAQKLYYEPSKSLSLQAYGSMFFMNSYDLIQDMTFSQSRDFMAGIKLKYDVKNWFTVNLSLHGDFYDRFKRHERIDERKNVYKSKIFEPRLTLTSSYFTGHNIILGVEHTTDELTSDRFVNRRMTTRSLHETEYFLQDEWTVNSHWMLSSGVRTNFSKAFGFMWMPKIAIKYAPDNHWALRANYSMGYRAPSIKELFFNWDHLGMFQIKGSENLQSEKNNYFSLGAEYSKDRFFINVNAYANIFNKKIEGVWRIYDMQYNFEYINLKSQRMLGIEAIMKWRLTDNFMLNATYSYVNVSKQNGIQVNTTSPHAATASIDYTLNRPNYRLKSIFSTSIMGEKKFDVQDRVWVKEHNKSYDAYFRCILPTYVLCNLSVVQTFYNKVKLTIGVDNIFNYVPHTLGSGVTMFNVPATCGARGYVQVEFLVEDILKSLKHKK
ncbi:TonB-dependent receptor [Hoylesella nanceiensis]|uniref:TonB-dependent receptor n=1 Tax=Hoylesella nanceiensis TaxID=425941 RepID=A0ABS6YBB0_9BACT|nr:TonB-dependent receptor [Hoylesella nanceiensis]MBW4768867.1 TonB-dependent receptor [Hoylesella nanceiensis]